MESKSTFDIRLISFEMIKTIIENDYFNMMQTRYRSKDFSERQ